MREGRSWTQETRRSVLFCVSDILQLSLPQETQRRTFPPARASLGQTRRAAGTGRSRCCHMHMDLAGGGEHDGQNAGTDTDLEKNGEVGGAEGGEVRRGHGGEEGIRSKCTLPFIIYFAQINTNIFYEPNPNPDPKYSFIALAAHCPIILHRTLPQTWYLSPLVCANTTSFLLPPYTRARCPLASGYQRTPQAHSSPPPALATHVEPAAAKAVFVRFFSLRLSSLLLGSGFPSLLPPG
jgi:hypothetical protein